MAFQYPDKPWQDGQTIRQDMEDGSVLIGQYNASKNLWSFGRSSADGSTGVITTADVFTLNERPTDDQNPFSLSNDAADVKTQQEVNWWIYEHLGARFPIFADSPPTLHPDYEPPDSDLAVGDIWINVSEPAQYAQLVWDGENWIPIGPPSRTPIFSDTEPTEHPDFAPPANQIIPGDYWYDVSDPDEIVQYIWNGTEWLKIGGDFVHRRGGDSMQGPLSVTGGRNEDANGIVSTVKALNVDSGQDSALQLRHNGNTRFYVGGDGNSTVGNFKFTTNGANILSANSTDLLHINNGSISPQQPVVFQGDSYISGKSATSLGGRAGLEIQCSGDKPLAISNSGSYQETVAIYGYDGNELGGRGKNMTIGAQGNVNTEGYINAAGHVKGSELRSIKLTSGQNSNLEIHRGSGTSEERKMLIGANSVNFDVDINMLNHKVSNLADPVDDQDAVNLKTFNTITDEVEWLKNQFVLGVHKAVSSVYPQNKGDFSAISSTSSPTFTLTAIRSIYITEIGLGGQKTPWDTFVTGREIEFEDSTGGSYYFTLNSVDADVTMSDGTQIYKLSVTGGRHDKGRTALIADEPLRVYSLVNPSTSNFDTDFSIDSQGDPHFANHRLEDVADPVAATDAATKGYVDSNPTGVLEGKLKNKGSLNSPTSAQFVPMYGASYNSGNVNTMNRIQLHSLDGYDFRTTGSAACPGTLTVMSRGDCLWHGIIEKKSVSGDTCTLYLIKLYAKSAAWDTTSDYYFHINGFKRDLS